MGELVIFGMCNKAIWKSNLKNKNKEIINFHSRLFFSARQIWATLVIFLCIFLYYKSGFHFRTLFTSLSFYIGGWGGCYPPLQHKKRKTNLFTFLIKTINNQLSPKLFLKMCKTISFLFETRINILGSSMWTWESKPIHSFGLCNFIYEYKLNHLYKHFQL